jgi:hypothetical protein
MEEIAVSVFEYHVVTSVPDFQTKPPPFPAGPACFALSVQKWRWRKMGKQ